MKRSVIIILSILAAGICTSSCNKWLEATSNTRIPADKMFETRGGFCDALSGVYILMGDEKMYGGNMTFAYADLAAYPYNYSTNNTIKAAQQHQYSYRGVKSSLLNIWRTSYNAIANINLALDELEIHGDVLTTDAERSLFKGELCGLRALIHFDLLRLYGLGNVTGDNASKMTIPYVTVFEKEPCPQRTYAETFELLKADIDTALTCLGKYDPVSGNLSEADLNSINQDGFWNNRGIHFNYCAALGLAARYYQWIYDLGNADKYARQAVQRALDSGIATWIDPATLLIDTAEDNKDVTLSCENLFSLYITDMLNHTSALNAVSYGSENPYLLPDLFVDNTLYVRLDPTTGSLAGAEDVRGPAYHLKFTAAGYQSWKFYTGFTGPYKNKFPIMRLSEMYYISAEKSIADSDEETARELLDEVRRHRGITANLPESCNVKDELMKECYREFMNEGKLIAWLKHFNVESSLYPNFDLKASDLVFPYPDEETDYGRKQDL